MQRLKVRNLKAPAGSVLSIGTSGNVTSNVNNTLFGVTSASFSEGIFTINCFGFTSNSNVYLGRTQLVNNGVQGNVLTATANTTISNGVYNINLYDPATGGSAVLPNGVTYANYDAWITGYTTNLLRISLINLTQTVSTRTTNAINNRENASGVSTSDYGWIAGGWANDIFTPFSTVNRLTFSNDTSGYVTRSNMPYSAFSMYNVTDQTTYGWFGGGYNIPTIFSSISRLIYANDTTSTTQRAVMSEGQNDGSSSFTTQYGWFYGGDRKNAPATSSILRIDYSQDTNTPSVRVSLPTDSNSSSAMGTNEYGWIAGGMAPATVSTVLRLTYSNDTIAPSVRGPLVSILRYGSHGVNTNTDGFIVGGTPSLSAIHRIQFSNDTATGTILSYNLGENRLNDAAFDNYIH